MNYTRRQTNPIDDTVVGSTALSRNNEVTLAFLGFGGDFHNNNARVRLMTQFGIALEIVRATTSAPSAASSTCRTRSGTSAKRTAATTGTCCTASTSTPASSCRTSACSRTTTSRTGCTCRRITSDNTPWFFNGIRTQIFPTDKLKIEPWLINGWQSYGKFNEMPGFGGQIMWRPVEWVSVLSNDYFGWDTQDLRALTASTRDNSLNIRYYDNPRRELIITRMAFSFTGDIGGEHGDGVVPFGGTPARKGTTASTQDARARQQFASWMLYNRLWFFGGHLAWTMGGGMMHNPGRYLVLAPTGNASPFPQPLNVQRRSSDPFPTWSPARSSTRRTTRRASNTCPTEYTTWDLEFNHRAGERAVLRRSRRRDRVRTATRHGDAARLAPDLIKADSRIILALLVRF